MGCRQSRDSLKNDKISNILTGDLWKIPSFNQNLAIFMKYFTICQIFCAF